MSSFQLQFPGCNDSVRSVLPSKDSQYDLAIFLSVIQKLDIEFLPVMRNAFEAFGRAGTADIRQAVVNIDTAFAFKHASRLFDERGEVDAYRALVSEVLVLGNPAVRDHPNVIDLEGIYWEFDAKDLHLRPVLVFEKSAAWGSSTILEHHRMER
jgi:hypothetical protein